MKTFKLALIQFAVVAMFVATTRSSFGQNTASVNALNADPVTCEKFGAFLKSSKVLSIDALLEAMSKSPQFSEFLKGYTFAYRSFSLQKATPEEPRAIVYGQAANMVMTFLNRADTKGKDAIELMCWSEQEFKFSFIELVFDGKTEQQIRPQNVNPQTCLKCHGQDPRPNWDIYNQWAGFYGSKSRGSCDMIERGSPELAMYTEFLSTRRKTGRYRFLPEELRDGNASVKRCHELNADAKDFRNFRNAQETSPNSNLTQVFTERNALRVRRILGTHPEFQVFKYALAAVAKTCDAIETFFPEDIRNIPSTPEHETERMRQNFLRKSHDLSQFQPTNTGRYFDHQDFISSRRYPRDFAYVLRKMDLEHSKIGTPFKDGEMDAGTFGSPFVDFYLPALWPSVDRETENLTCDQLKVFSLRSLRKASQIRNRLKSNEQVTMAESSETKAILKSCQSCHDNSAARRFNFENEIAIKNELKADPRLVSLIEERIFDLKPRTQSAMPPDRTLTPDQKIRLVNYLKNLSESSKAE